MAPKIETKVSFHFITSHLKTSQINQNQGIQVKTSQHQLAKSTTTKTSNHQRSYIKPSTNKPRNRHHNNCKMSKYHQTYIRSSKFDLKLEDQDNLWTNMLHILDQRGEFVDTKKLANI